MARKKHPIEKLVEKKKENTQKTIFCCIHGDSGQAYVAISAKYGSLFELIAIAIETTVHNGMSIYVNVINMTFFAINELEKPLLVGEYRKKMEKI